MELTPNNTDFYLLMTLKKLLMLLMMLMMLTVDAQFSIPSKLQFRMKIFDQLAKYITSMAAVLVVMIATITGMVLFSHTLFTSVFPETMEPWEKMLATWFLAVAWEAGVLISTVNTKHLNKNIPGVLAICSGAIVLFFIHGFDTSQPWLTLMQRWFVGILAATINYIYADLFYAKWLERIDLIERPAKFIELQSTVNQLQSRLNESESKLKNFDELEKFKYRIEAELTCPHCKNKQNSFGSLHAHKGHCHMNPRNLEKDL